MLARTNLNNTSRQCRSSRELIKPGASSRTLYNIINTEYLLLRLHARAKISETCDKLAIATTNVYYKSVCLVFCICSTAYCLLACMYSLSTEYFCMVLCGMFWPIRKWTVDVICLLFISFSTLYIQYILPRVTA